MPGRVTMCKNAISTRTWYAPGGEVNPLLEHKKQGDLNEAETRETRPGKVQLVQGHGGLANKLCPILRAMEKRIIKKGISLFLYYIL